MPKPNPCVKNCLKCNNPIPSSIIVNGTRKRLFPRNYCLICSPWGAHNNRKLEALRTDGLKTCNTCQFDKSKKLFSDTSGVCNECFAKKMRQKMRTIKAKCVEYLGGKCANCGYNKCQAALDFHHKDPTQKEFAIGRRGRQEFDKLKPELDKCDLLCRNCHAEVHFSDIEADDAIAPSPSPDDKDVFL